MKTIDLLPLVGTFAENKDLAREIRIKQLVPSLENGQEVILDFEGIGAATQSFIHALISDLFRLFGGKVLDVLYFKNCSDIVKKIIGIVVEYMQESG